VLLQEHHGENKKLNTVVRMRGEKARWGRGSSLAKENAKNGKARVQTKVGKEGKEGTTGRNV